MLYKMGIIKIIRMNVPQMDILFLWVFIILFAAPLKYYFPTTFIVEASCIFLILYYSWSKTSLKVSFHHNERYFFFSFLMLAFFAIGLRSDYDTFCFKESYRFFIIFLFAAIFISCPLKYDSILSVSLFLCKLHILFTVYEVLYLNVISVGNFDGLLISGRSMSEMNDDSPYLKPAGDLGIWYIRPFGLMLQPQKSSFIFSVGMISKFFLDRIKDKLSGQYWYFVFLLATILTAGKTAILCSVLLYFALRHGIYPKRLSLKYGNSLFIFLIVSLIGTVILIYLKGTVVGGNFAQDFFCIFNYPLIDSLLGHGIPSVPGLESHGFSVECYIARIVLQVGYLPFLLFVIPSIAVFRAKEWKINYIMIVLYFSMVSHYCVINCSFFQFMIPVFIGCYKSYKW